MKGIKFCEFVSNIICEWDFCECCVISASNPGVMNKYLKKVGSVPEGCDLFWTTDSFMGSKEQDIKKGEGIK